MEFSFAGTDRGVSVVLQWRETGLLVRLGNQTQVAMALTTVSAKRLSCIGGRSQQLRCTGCTTYCVRWSDQKI